VTEPGSPAAQVDANDVLALLENEVREAELDRQRRGWNGWIIGAALAALIWTGITLYETSKVDIAATIRMWLIAAIVIEVIHRAFAALTQTPRTADSRFIIPSEELRRRQGFILPVLGHALVLAALLWLSPTTPRWATITVFAIVVISLLGILPAVVRLLLNLPLSDAPNRNRTVQYLLFCLIIGILGMGVRGLAAPLELASPNVPLPEFKLALVGLGIWYLVPILISEAAPSWFLQSLRSLRRDVQLGALEPAEALQRTEDLLLGMKGTSVADALLAPLITDLVAAEARTEAISADFACLSELSLQAYDPNCDPKTLDQFHQASTEVLARLQNDQPMSRQLNARVDGLIRRLAWARFVSPSLVLNAAETFLALLARLQRSQARWAEFENSIIEVKGRIREIARSSRKDSTP
jgi:hypothetical protein